MEDKENEVKTIIGRDFNARTGKKGERIVEREETDDEGQRRGSKHGRLDKEGRILLDIIEKKEGGAFIIGWYRGMRKESSCSQKKEGIR